MAFPFLTIEASDAGGKPTPRAISERLFKLRKANRGNGDSGSGGGGKGNFSGLSIKKKDAKPTTPRKRKAGIDNDDIFPTTETNGAINGSSSPDPMTGALVKKEADANDQPASQGSNIYPISPASTNGHTSLLEEWQHQSPSKKKVKVANASAKEADPVQELKQELDLEDYV